MINFTRLNRMALVFKWRKTKIFPVHVQTNILKSYIKRVPYSTDFDDHIIATLALHMTEE